MLIDGMIVIASGYSAMYLKISIGGQRWALNEYQMIGIVFFTMVINNIAMGLLGLYSDRRFSSVIQIIVRIIYDISIVFAVLVFTLYVLKIHAVSRIFLVSFAFFMFLGIVISRIFLDIFLDRIQRTGFNAWRILLIGNGAKLECTYQALLSQKGLGQQILGVLHPDEKMPSLDGSAIPYLGNLNDFFNVLIEKNVDEVIFALESDYGQDIKEYLELCEIIGVSYKIVPAMYNPFSPFRLSVEHIHDVPTLTRETTGIDAAGLLYKRLIDFFFGCLGCVMLFCMYPFVALAIRLDSPGPVFFKQERVGRNGRIFTIYKFRTMVVDAEESKDVLMGHNEMKGLMFKMNNDPRITKVGRFLRKTSLDEFPQFINVIRGEMSLVGTRPPTKEEVMHYETWHRRRISMKPGITGLWQVSGRNKVNDFAEVVKLDLQYIDHWKIINDLKIIAMTVWVILRRKGAI